MSNSSATCGALHCTTATSIYSGPPVLMPAGASCRFHASLGMQSTSASFAQGRPSGSVFLLQPASMHSECDYLAALFKWQLKPVMQRRCPRSSLLQHSLRQHPQQQPGAAQRPISVVGGQLQAPDQ